LFYSNILEKITSILATSDDKYLISASRDCNIHICDISKREVTQTILKAHKGKKDHSSNIKFQIAPITGLALSSDNNTLISVSRDKSIKFHSLITFEEINAIVDAHDGIVYFSF
jgi:WD40 repeat protein